MLSDLCARSLGDEAQIIWCSLISYLQFVKSLDFAQNFIKTETIVALCDLHIGTEFPNITQGIAQSVHNVLQDDFDLKSFLVTTESRASYGLLEPSAGTGFSKVSHVGGIVANPHATASRLS
jgi:hypothetical protein